MTSAAPSDPFGRSHLPADFSRADRVRLLAEVAQALLDGHLPSRPAALFVAGGIDAWLREGGRCGDLERLYWRVAAPRSSRHTPSELWRRACSSRGTTGDDEAGTMPSDNLETDTEGQA